MWQFIQLRASFGPAFEGGLLVLVEPVVRDPDLQIFLDASRQLLKLFTSGQKW